MYVRIRSQVLLSLTLTLHIVSVTGSAKTSSCLIKQREPNIEKIKLVNSIILITVGVKDFDTFLKMLSTYYVFFTVVMFQQKKVIIV